jgi:hypothetical protein
MRSLTQLVSISFFLAATTAGNKILFFDEAGCDSVSSSGCQNIGEATCCFSKGGGKAVSISKGPLDVAIGWFEDFSADNLCGVSTCTAGGSGTICCVADLAEYTGGSFYTIRSDMSSASAEQQKCTSSQEPNIFGVVLSDGQHLMIGHDEAKARSASFAELHEAFKKVPPADAEAWLLQNGATLSANDSPITETIVVVSNSLSYLANPHH